ncbi:MAG: serine/threonine-protein kinase [Polyangiales bacterium]
MARAPGDSSPESSGPTRFGRYTLLARLGSGGMADAMLAMLHGDLGFQKLVVIKRMHASLGGDEHFVRMFVDEARLAARLNHPNVVSTTEVGEVDGQYFIAMEYLEGLSLDRVVRSFLQKGEGVPLGFLTRVLCDALEGLHYAHELADFDGRPLAVVHRDVTPSNLFVTYDGLAKVLDFGIAKAATHDEATRTGMLKGKLSYMSPEQFYPDPVDRRSDLWSMGVLIWEMVTGRRLFKGPNDAATFQNIMHMPVPAMASFRDEVPEELDAIVARALSRERGDRFESAEAMRATLESVLIGPLGNTTRAEVAALMRSRFGDIVEQNRKTIRAYATPNAAQPSAPLGLGADGALRPGGGATIPPSAVDIDPRALAAIDPRPPSPRAGVTLDTQDEGAATEVSARPDFTPEPVPAVIPGIRVTGLQPVLAPLPQPYPPQPAPSYPPPAAPAVTPAEGDGFDPVPAEVLAVQRAAKARARRRQRLEAAVGWLLLLVVVGGLGGFLWTQRAWIRAGADALVHGTPPDPRTVGQFRLRIFSEPSGARVFEGGNEIGRTPLEMYVHRSQVAQQPRVFTLSYPGHATTRAIAGNTQAAASVLRVTLPVSNPRAPAAGAPRVVAPRRR